ncbi:hypothetical protein ES705_34950 [subsurface metagenome]
MTEHISFRDITYELTPDGLLITIITDIPCHIFIRWSELQPWIHSKPVLRRGMWLNDDVRFCFDVYTDTEQNEDGDTLIHTFLVPSWMLDKDYWLYPWGMVDGNVSPSSGPIFHTLTPPSWPPPPEPVRYAWSRVFTRTGSLRYVDAGYKHAPTFQITPTPTTSVHFLLFSQNNDASVVRVSLSLVDDTGKPLDTYEVWQDIILTGGVFDPRSSPTYPVYIHTVALPYIYTPNTHYALVQETLVGQAQWWQRFRSTGWLGDMDAGEEHHVAYHATHLAYPDWTPVSPGRSAYEGWGYQ